LYGLIKIISTKVLNNINSYLDYQIKLSYLKEKVFMVLKEFKLFSFLLIFVLLFSSFGSAAATGTLASPGSFQVKFNNIQTYTGQETVENTGNAPLNIIVLVKRMQKDDVSLLFSDTGIATWINATPNNFTLAPNQKQVITFTITPPPSYNVNDAVGALLIQGYPIQTNSSSTNNDLPSVNVQQVPELIIPIVVGLPGPIIESLNLINDSTPSALLTFMPGTFKYDLNNNGTVYANTTANIELSGWFNKHNITANSGIYPGDNATIVTQWKPGLLDFGVYDVKTNITYGRDVQNKNIVTDNKIFVFPVWIIIIVMLILTIWIIRKKEVKSPLKIKIERK
jgi:hypothetical protein